MFYHCGSGFCSWHNLECRFRAKLRNLQESVDAGPFSEGRRTDIYQNSLGPDPILMGASLGSFALAGVMLLVGFIAGPKKRETPT